MTTPTMPLDPKVWADANPTGSAVWHYPGGDRTTEPVAAVIAQPPLRYGDGVYRVAIAPTWDRVPIEHLDPHPQRAALAALDAPETMQLEFPPPPCPYCGIDCDSDGDSFTCPGCGAWWSDLHRGKRACVECGTDAEVSGDDQQPRCRPCALAVITGANPEPTGPYRCTDRYCTSPTVHGVGLELAPREAMLCPRHWVDTESRRRVEEILARRATDGRPVPAADGEG